MIEDIRDINMLKEIIERRFRDVIRNDSKQKQSYDSEFFDDAMRVFPLLAMVARDEHLTAIIILAQAMNTAEDAREFVQFIIAMDADYRKENKEWIASWKEEIKK